MKVYLSGPISLNGAATPEMIEKHLDQFREEARFQRVDLGNTVLSPAELPPQPDWASYMRICIPMVASADEIVMLPGWEKSRGAVFEFEVAHVCGLDVDYR